MVREWSEVDIGQSWAKSPFVLSWKDVEAPGMADGFNEVIYEAVNCLDLLEGAVNGRASLSKDLRSTAPVIILRTSVAANRLSTCLSS